MKSIVWTVLAASAGVALGLGATWASIETPPNFGVVHASPWMARPKIGALDADPYSKALMAARGEIPTSAAEGMTLTATHDSDGRRLNAACAYRLSGAMPAANYWTLTVYAPDGALLSRAARASLSSAEALFGERGEVSVALSAEAQAGDWIALAGKGRFEVYLRLYETQISTNAYALDKATTPAITRVACP